MSGEAFCSTALTIIIVVSFFKLVFDVIHLSGIPVTGIIVFHYYPAIDLVIQILVILMSFYYLRYGFSSIWSGLRLFLVL